MKKTLLILLCSIFLFSGCITTKLNKTVNRCETADCIQMNFGPPTHIQKNGEFGEVWTYGGSTMRIFIDKNNKVYKREVKHSDKYDYGYSTLTWFTSSFIVIFLWIGSMNGQII